MTISNMDLLLRLKPLEPPPPSQLLLPPPTDCGFMPQATDCIYYGQLASTVWKENVWFIFFMLNPSLLPNHRSNLSWVSFLSYLLQKTTKDSSTTNSGRTQGQNAEFFYVKRLVWCIYSSVCENYSAANHSSRMHISAVQLGIHFVRLRHLVLLVAKCHIMTKANNLASNAAWLELVHWILWRIWSVWPAWRQSLGEVGGL